MKLHISSIQIRELQGIGDHIYIKGVTVIDDVQQPVDVFFRDKKEEKKVFENSTTLVSGELIAADGGHAVLNARILEVKLTVELPLEDMTIKDRLYATGLIHEFKDIYRKDKIRAVEILKVLGVRQEYAEDLLLRTKQVLPFL